MKIAIYARVSTNDQKVEMQINDLRTYVAQRGFTIFKEYIDHGFSGAKDRRPALNELMEDAKKRKFDCVLVWRFDRFGRSLKHLVTALEEFQHLGISFISYQEALDTSSPAGKVLFSVIGAFAEFERNIIRERVIAGLRSARANGKQLGRPKHRDDQKIRVLRSQGRSLREISQELNISLGSVQRSLASVSKTHCFEG